MSVFCNADLEQAPTHPLTAGLPQLQSAPHPATPPDPIRAAREFEAICTKHNLHCGSPEDLAGFLSALETNKLLAMNFWALVARLTEPHEGAALDSSELLGVIARGVAGASVDEANERSRAEVEKLTRLLAGEDVQLAPGGGASARPNAARNAQRSRPEPDTTPVAAEAAASQPEADTAAPDLIPPDQPALDPPGAARPDPFYGQRLSLRPDLPRASVESSEAVDRVAGPSTFGSLASYADQQDRHHTGRIGAAVLVVALAAGVCLFFSRGYSAWEQPGNTARAAVADFGGRSAAIFSRIGGSVRAGFESARDAWRGQSGSPRATPTVPASSPGSGSALSDRSTTTPPLPPKSAGAHGSHQATQPAPPNTQLQTATSSAASVAPDVPLRAAAIEHNRGLRERASARFDPDASLVGDNRPVRGGEMVVVPAELMRDRLISSRVPILPDNVSSQHGYVVLHAIVTSRGTVRDIHAVMGRHELVQAAIDAVSAWRYRPYLLNGTPVDVATTINVSFDGND